MEIMNGEMKMASIKLRDENFTDYIVLKLIQRKKYETVYQLRKDFKKITNYVPSFSVFYNQIKKLKNKNYVLIKLGKEISLTNKGEKRLIELEKTIFSILTLVSCGVDS